MPTFDGKDYATDKDLVEAVAATLELPRGLVDDDALAQWSEGLGARGWTVAERSDTHYRLTHASSGFMADLQVLRYDPAAPDTPVLDLATEPQPDALRPAFSTVRLSAPGDSGLLADANLMSPAPDGTVTWLITHAEPSGMDATDETATASPFEGAAQASTSQQGAPGGKARGGISRSFTSVLVFNLLLAVVTLLLLRRSERKGRS